MKKYPIYNIQRFNCNSVNSDLYINTFKNHLIDHSFVEEPHRHNSYVLVFFTKGSGTHEIDFDVFSIQRGSMFFLQPGQMHHWDLSDDVEGFVIFYSQEMYNLYFGQKIIGDYPFYSSVNNTPEMVFDAVESKAILPYFDNIISETQGNQMLKQDKIMNLLDSIHIEIARKYSETLLHEAHSYNVKIKNFEVLLEKNFKTERTPSFYASQLHITLKHLNRICNEILKKTTTEVITDRIILEAKRMLMDKKMTVNEIATELGFDDYSYFTRLFKKHTAMTPTAFRIFKR
ncbi:MULTISPECIES: helix-turn-helix domain-containing protein [Flavobacterium]|uniref:Helix-turn-helix domain-containing protein n=1 Tax=Flavobacterium gawalongense TaxID=2594432 RepID=A0A553BXL6_9FLAO|nr:helix-turn-helix domain-containing protein [Flavobacterium gawalongense]TRX04289.1 helix-turn-helix domain-containing protein [Flavobacterium gawalongense]TRX09263.1 helix-turn-helix domain-containing protein [Flavobacterium gawalongense]TRX12925.1 helix-turn-helix domain-containing protein [Flavobacterium gawalongense]TRX13269.1 helix-turn-helix domain-containing protein [Flavobacterium gawalongense]TRX30669.1 helix-turn-helix domain-containing protein [Flavobacterium gawalongense]